MNPASFPAAMKQVSHSLCYINLSFILQHDSDNVEAKGRLISKVSDDSSSGDRWLVGYDDGLQPNEEMNESRFGEILGKDTPISTVSAQHPPRSRKNSTSSATSTKEFKGDDGASSLKQQNQSTSFSGLDLSRSSSNNEGKKGKTSKSKKVDLGDDPYGSVPTSDMSSSPVDEKASLVVSIQEQRGERRFHHPLRDIGRPLKKQKMPKQKEDVVRIPMKTGVLLLYKGLHRRAEFVRKV